MAISSPPPANDFFDGFLVKDKSGTLTKVPGGVAVDVTDEPATPVPQPTTPESSPSPFRPQPPISTSSVAPLSMEPEEEAEIKEHEDKVKSLGPSYGADHGGAAQQLATSLQEALSLRFDSTIAQKRFEKIIESRLRGVRNSVETIEALSRPEKIGGLAMPAETAQRVVAALEPAVRQSVSKQQPGQPLSTGKTGNVADAPPAFMPRPGGAAASAAFVPLAAPRPEPSRPSVPAVTPAVTPTIAAAPVSTPSKPAPAASAEPHQLYRPRSSDLPKVTSPRGTVPNRPSVIDIKQPATLTGPVDELRQLDLKEFRRMGGNPAEAAEKVLEKIELLQEESWAIKLKGITSWKSSPLFQQYVATGVRSIEEGVPVVDFLNRRQQGDPQGLVVDEFFAINDLNTKLEA